MSGSTSCKNHQKKKLLISFAVWTASYTIMGVLGGTMAYYRFPRTFDDKEPHPLPDVLFEIIPEHCPKILGQNIQR